ncbi:MAG TPA: branched-chain amino acid ABC transporter permease [Hyphomicrobiales bacterium]|nr:branched-chain amino acid ABC transporter permease [Hyphomicrobiales bacterium]
MIAQVSALLRGHAGTTALALVGLGLLFGLPLGLETYVLLQVTVYVTFAILALSLGFVLGFGGILCLGQSVFFGLGAYTYGIAVTDMGDSTIPVLLSVAVPSLFAAALGYFIFWGRISDVYVGVITLTVSLIFFSVVNSTAGPQYHIGAAAIGGYNGMPNIPGINLPFEPDDTLDPNGVFYLTMGSLLVCYFGLRWLLTTTFGRVVVAVRENERRVELLGYDARRYKLLALTLGAAIAGLAGCLFANWGSFVGPSVFSVVQSAQILIWVTVGGAGTLLGPVIGSILISWLTAVLGTQQTLNASLVLGFILLVFVLVVPGGIAAVARRARTAAARLGAFGAARRIGREAHPGARP